jgi:hypothetical protein
MNRTPEEEREYRRHIQRLARREKRRRKVLLARLIFGIICLIILFLLVHFLSFAFHKVASIGNTQQTVETLAPGQTATPKPLQYSVPEGYEKKAAKLEAMRGKYPEVKGILVNLYAYPKSILHLVIKNPETISFALNYPLHKTDTESGGTITAKEMESKIPLLLQWDERWGYLVYGDHIIAIDGCGPTCLSMVVSGLLRDSSKDPAAIAAFSIDHGYYTSDTGTAWNLMYTGARKLGLQVTRLNLTADNIREHLAKGEPIICTMKPGDFTTQGHFIVLTGLTHSGKLKINDPNSKVRSKKTWDVDRVLRQTKAMWSYQKPE